MGFVDNLRMSSLFGGGGSPLGGVKVAPPQDLVTDYATRILPLIHGEQDRQQYLNQQVADRIRTQKQQDEDNARQHPNVVFNSNGANGINPLQKANLELKQEAEQGKNDRASAALSEKQGYGQSVIKIRQQANDIANFKATHPNVQITAQKGGNYHIYDPAHPELGMQDTGIDTGTSSDEEKAKLGFDNNLQLIKARGDQSRQTDSQRAGEATDLQIMKGNQATDQINTRGDQTRETNRESNTQRGDNSLTAIAARAAEQRRTNAVKPRAGMTPTQQKADYFNKAQQLSTDPAYGKYVKMDKDNPGKFIVDPNTPQDIYHDINSRIYGGIQDTELPADDNTGFNSDQSDAPAAKDALGIRK